MSFDIDAAMPFIADTLYRRLRCDVAPEWEAFVQHRFVRQLADGTLPRDEFLAWMVQDYRYLVSYARAYALLVYKSDTVARMRNAAAIMSGLLEGEMTMHRQQLAAAGISEAYLDDAPEAIETLAYGRYVLDRAQTGDALDLVVTLSACLAGYGEIGLRLRCDPATRHVGNPYEEWIAAYAGEAYIALVRNGCAALQDLADEHGGQARYPALLKQFRQSVRLETAFWDAGRSVPAAAR